MARHGGLPKAIIAKYGISKKAWAVYRHGGHRRSNPKRTRRTPPRTASGRFRKRRRNPTGHPLSGPAYRPRFRVTRSGVRHGPRFAAVPQRRLLRAARSHVHHRRVRHNPARKLRKSRRGSLGFGHGRSLSMGSTKGFLQRYVPLVSPESRHVIRTYKGHAILGSVAGLLVTSVASSAGGAVAGVIVTVGGGIVIRYFTKTGKNSAKFSAVASGFVLGGLVAVGMNMLAGGSLTGTAKLGSTMRNLKAIARRVQMQGLKGLGDVASTGLFGVPVASVNAQLSKWGLPKVSLPALTGVRGKLGDYFNGETYNPVTQVGLHGAARNAQGWGVPGSTGF